MSTKKAIHFGGGNIGRGFVAEFLHNSGYEVVFVDVMDELIDSFKRTRSYSVTEIGAEGEHTTTIDNYRAINSKKNEPQAIEEITTADIVTCAVGPNILKFIAPVIAKGIHGRKKDTQLSVIACENMIGGTDALKGYIEEKMEDKEALTQKAIFANSAIDRIVPAQDDGAGLDVKIEKFFEWCVEVTPWKTAGIEHPEIQGVHFVDDLEPYIERKLYTVNTSHATAAYFGFYHKKQTIHEAMEDPKVKQAVREAVQETAHLIVNKHGITKKDQDNYVEQIISRISNPHLKDMVERVGRAPIRKLGKKERFIGPAIQLLERGDKIDALLAGVEMALRFQNVPGDEESEQLAKILKEKSATEATKDITGLEESQKIFPLIVKIVEKVQSSSGTESASASL